MAWLCVISIASFVAKHLSSLQSKYFYKKRKEVCFHAALEHCNSKHCRMVHYAKKPAWALSVSAKWLLNSHWLQTWVRACLKSSLAVTCHVTPLLRHTSWTAGLAQRCSSHKQRAKVLCATPSRTHCWRCGCFCSVAVPTITATFTASSPERSLGRLGVLAYLYRVSVTVYCDCGSRLRMHEQLPWTVTYWHELYHHRCAASVDEVYPRVLIAGKTLLSALSA